MKTLLLDTSTFDVVVGIVDDGDIVDAVQQVAEKRQSEMTIPVIETVLKKHHWTLSMIDQIVITVGPGSYTGVRIAMTIAKTIAVINPSVKLFGLSSLQAYSGMAENICTIIDARSNKYFIGYYHNGIALRADTIIDADHLDVAQFRLNDCTKSIEHINVVKQMMDLKAQWVEVKHVHQLVPTYIKEVEARRLDRSSQSK